jgi:putative hydrolase
MAVVEGHGNYVMRHLGRLHVPEYGNLEERLAARQQRGPLERWFLRMSGLAWKMQQYERGEAFIEAVAKAHGEAGFRRIWSGPAALPTLEELADPEAWWERTSHRAPAKRWWHGPQRALRVSGRGSG